MSMSAFPPERTGFRAGRRAVTSAPSGRLFRVAAALAAVAVALPWSSHRVAIDVPISVRSSAGGISAWAWGVIHDETGLQRVVLGTQHPARVLAVLGALGVWAALRRGSRRGALVAVALAAVALPLGPWEGGPQPGRACYALALMTAVAAILTARTTATAPGVEPTSR